MAKKIAISGFVRKFDGTPNTLTGKKKELWELLEKDVLKGEVFPAVRKNEIHFYYKGGCLYKFKGSSFRKERNKNYEEKKYSKDTAGLTDYEKAKKQNENKFSNDDGTVKERQLLDKLYCHTFNKARKTNVVVLDIEVRLNGKVSTKKKCDLVLLNTRTNQIMFVEGKVFADKRVNVRVGKTPEVIVQVNNYSDAIQRQKTEIEKQYGEHIKIVNKFFGTEYNEKVEMLSVAKLIVYKTPMPDKLSKNGKHVINIIPDKLGEKNVMWVHGDSEPTLDEIWEKLCK